MSIIEAKNLTFSYKTDEKEKVILDKLNLNIEKGSFNAIIGHNGSGKSTFAKHINAILLPQGGSISVCGIDSKDEEKLYELRKAAGMVFQNPDNQIVATIVEEDVAFGLENIGIECEEMHRRVKDSLMSVNMYEYRKRAPHLLSGGQKQKASLVASLVHRPDILFLDEPTIGLDPTTKRTLWDLIRELNDDGHTIILCSHDMHEVDMLCDNVGIINTGNLVAYDTPQGLKDALLEENKRELTEALSQVHSESDNPAPEIEDLESLSLRKMSFLLQNHNESIISSLQDNETIKDFEIARNGRINLKIDAFDDMAVYNILKDIISSGGIIKSIFTEEPSLEDVFIKATAEVDEDARA